MRTVFSLILLVGAAIGFGYPWAITRLSGHEIGTWRVQDTAAGFHAIETKLSASDAPVRVTLEVAGMIPPGIPPDQSILTVTAAKDTRTVLAEAVGLAKAEKQEDSPQTQQQVYRFEAGTLIELNDGLYRFTVGPGEATGVQLASVDLVLLGGIGAYDPRAQPIGLSIMAIGFIGLAIAIGRRRRGTTEPQAEPSTSAKPRWGRGQTPN